MKNRVILPYPAIFLCIACGGDVAPAGKEKPATVDNPQAEAALTRVTLSAEAFTRLGVEVVTADSAAVPVTRTLGGEVVVAPGHRADVVAPVAGKVMLPADQRRWSPGESLARGVEVVRLLPFPPEGDLVRSAEDLRVAEARYAAARAESDRVQALFAERLVARREVERASADLEAAEAQRDAARARVQLARTGQAENAPGLTPLSITAPMEGTLLSLSVGDGQVVAAGTPLFSVAQLGRLWVKVPVYAGDARAIARGEGATVRELSGSGSLSVPAVPVTSPPSADAGASSVDLYYALAQARSLRPGERVSVTVPLGGQRKRALVVPLAALLYDVSGDAWVYVRTDSLVFTRRRIEVGNVVGDRVLVTRGLARGMRVVTAGAVELFGTEFGPGK